MSYSHLHILMNHVPVLGILFGVLLFIWGFIRKSAEVERVAMIVFVLSGIIAIPTFLTGDLAEHQVEEYAGVSENAIEEHEELATTALYMVLGVALSALTILIIMWRSQRAANLKLMKIVVFVFASITFGFLTLVSNSGGKIRRPELRNDIILLNEKNEKSDHDRHEHQEINDEHDENENEDDED